METALNIHSIIEKRIGLGKISYLKGDLITSLRIRDREVKPLRVSSSMYIIVYIQIVGVVLGSANSARRHFIRREDAEGAVKISALKV